MRRPCTGLRNDATNVTKLFGGNSRRLGHPISVMADKATTALYKGTRHAAVGADHARPTHMPCYMQPHDSAVTIKMTTILEYLVALEIFVALIMSFGKGRHAAWIIGITAVLVSVQYFVLRLSRFDCHRDIGITRIAAYSSRARLLPNRFAGPRRRHYRPGENLPRSA